MSRVYYLAYGSNLHPLRLAARVTRARLLGAVEVPGHRLAFHKRGVDGSGKCHVYAEQEQSDRMHGVLYEIDKRGKATLDRDERKNRGYREQVVKVSLHGVTWEPYLYVAQSSHVDSGLIPYHWYKSLVLAGARYHGFPAEYVQAIEATPSIVDPNIERARENEELLKMMRS